MSFLDPQNPGIGGLDELTDAEVQVVQALTALGDPGVDRIIFWDESANTFAYLTVGSGLSITGTELTASGGGTIDGSGTANELSYWVDSNTLGSLAVATYPSLTELSYIKGVTSAIQTQINGKQASGTYVTSISISSANGFTGSSTGGATPALTIVAGAITPTSVNGLTISTTTGTLTLTNAKTLAVTNSLTLSGTDGTTMTFPSTSKTIAANDGSNLTIASQAIGDILYASSTTAYTRLAAVAVGQVLVSAGTGTAPAYSANPAVTTLELGAGSTDTTLSRISAGVLGVEGIAVPTISSTSTITNKRNQPRIVSAASYTTDTGTSLDVSTTDIFVITAQAGALLFNAPSGTPVQGEKLIIRIKDNGTARALTWNAVFRAMGTALPSTTVLSKTLYLGFIYNSTDTKWDLVASAQEA